MSPVAHTTACTVGIRYDDQVVAACHRPNGDAEFLRTTPTTEDPAAATLADWVAARRLRGTDAVMSIPRRWLTVRYIDLPSQVAEEIEPLVHHRVSDLLADDPARYDLSWSAVETLANGWARVAVIACPHERLRGAIVAVEESGLRVAGVTIDSAALVAGLESLRAAGDDGDDEQAEGLVLVEDATATLAVARGGALLFSRQVRWRDRRPEEGDATSTERRLAGDAIEHFIRETMQSFRQRCPGIEIGSTWTLRTTDTEPLLPADLGATDLQRADLQAPDRPCRALAPSIATADLIPLGLTHGPAPLITPEWLLRRGRARALRTAAGRAALAVALLAAVLLGRAWSEIAAVETRLAAVTSELAVLETPARRLLALQERTAPERSERFRCLTALRAVEAALPRPTQLRSFDFVAPGRAVVVGSTTDVAHVVDMVHAMEAQPAVAGVELTETRRAGADDPARSTFVVQMTLADAVAATNTTPPSQPAASGTRGSRSTEGAR